MRRVALFVLIVVAFTVPASANSSVASRSLGLPWSGKLVGGVELPARSQTHFTWDDVRKQSPNRDWRRYGNARLVRMLERVVQGYAAAHPEAPRVGIGDLSRPSGGEFGRGFGGVGHASHQNGLDVDVYYPRGDRRERPPRTPAQVDRRLAQDLVDRFVAAGAAKVFIGAGTGLTGPPVVVEPLASYHENHMHVRLPGDGVRWSVIGSSTLGAQIGAFAIGSGRPRVLVVGCLHGDGCAGSVVATRLLYAGPPRHGMTWIVPDLNPDGHATGRRWNVRGIDLNRNFPGTWRPAARSGPAPGSEAETRVAMRLIERLRPDVTIWFDQGPGVVRASRTSASIARRYAQLTGMHFRRNSWASGSAPAWQQGAQPRTSSFVVGLRSGALGIRGAGSYAGAILRLGR